MGMERSWLENSSKILGEEPEDQSGHTYLPPIRPYVLDIENTGKDIEMTGGTTSNMRSLWTPTWTKSDLDRLIRVSFPPPIVFPQTQQEDPPPIAPLLPPPTTLPPPPAPPPAEPTTSIPKTSSQPPMKSLTSVIPKDNSPYAAIRARTRRRRHGHVSPKELVCNWCQATKTPEWRVGPEGDPLCNACGLQYLKKRREDARAKREAEAAAALLKSKREGTDPQ